MSEVLRFIIWVGGQARKYGVWPVVAAAEWARNNWPTVKRLLDTIGWTATLEYILRLLGYL